LKLTTDRHETSRGLFATAELLVIRTVMMTMMTTTTTILSGLQYVVVVGEWRCSFCFCMW